MGAAGPALLGADAGGRTAPLGVRNGYGVPTSPGEMPPGLNDEEALKWQMQTLGAQLRSEAVERAREQPSRQQSRAASPSGRREAAASAPSQGRNAGAPPPSRHCVMG